MSKVLFGLHMIDHPQQQQKGVYRSCVSTQRKRAVLSCFRQASLHSLPRLQNRKQIEIAGRGF
uniref:Ryanodine receptor-like isoform X2 n=1 Tax=Diabrotica virgifera virgifera TaxID=50390 RepID=A0A6P7GKB0_DIAVI